MSFPTSAATAVAAGSMQRRLGTLESFFKMLFDMGAPLNREHWAISTALQVSLPASIADTTPYVQRAWQLVRRQHPALGSVVQNDDAGGLQLYVGAFDPEAWVRDTFSVHDDVRSSNQLFSQHRPTPHATCHWIPASREVVFRTSHGRIDGMGLVVLSHDFLTALAAAVELGPDAPLDAYSAHMPRDTALDPCMEDLIASRTTKTDATPVANDGGDPIVRPSTPPQIAAGADKMIADLLSGVPSIGLPPTRPDSDTAIPDATARVSRRLDAATTSKLIQACKTQGLSVSSAVHAAIIRIAASYPQHPLCKAYGSLLPVDLRRVLERTAPDGELNVGPTGVYHTGAPVTVPDVAGKSFMDIAKTMNEAYRQDMIAFWGPDEVNGGGKTVGILDLVGAFVRRTTKLFGTPPPPELPPNTTPELSTIGVLEKFLQRQYGGKGEVELVDFWMGVETIARPVQFKVWTWRDQMTLGACFNLSYHEEEAVGSILDKVLEELLKGVGV